MNNQELKILIFIFLIISTLVYYLFKYYNQYKELRLRVSTFLSLSKENDNIVDEFLSKNKLQVIQYKQKKNEREGVVDKYPIEVITSNPLLRLEQEIDEIYLMSNNQWVGTYIGSAMYELGGVSQFNEDDYTLYQSLIISPSTI